MVRRGVGRKWRLVVPLALLVVGLLAPDGALAKRPRPAPCPDQRYLVQGTPALPGDQTPEAIVVSGRQVSLGAGCAPVSAKVAAKRKGTKIRARWASCQGLAGRVKLAALIDPTCAVMNGSVKARAARLRKAFTARASTCDDGVHDVEGGEQCEGTVITVDTTTDAPGDGHCSLQEAVLAANTSAGVDTCAAGVAGTTNTIAFAIPGDGVHTITVTSVTAIDVPVILDGRTQPGFAGVPLIHVTGVVEDLLRFDARAAGSTLRSLMLTNTNAGGLIDGATALFHGGGNRIVGNYFNTDGVVSIGDHGAGLLFESENNVIGGPTAEERNVFGGQTGIFLQDSSSNLVEGNYFGVQVDGVTPIVGLPATGNAIQIFNVLADAASNTIRNNVITGFLVGIQLFQGAHANTIRGNLIGLAADGTTVLGNGIGILAYGAPDNTIGGPSAADRNVIAGNTSTNITLQTVGPHATTGNTIAGNFIGADAGGDPVSPPALFGVYLVDGASENAITGNVITGSQQGVYVDATSAVGASSSHNCIEGNTTYGVNTANPAGAPFADNWWGDASGPRHTANPAGAGDWVSDDVAFTPFLTSRPAVCEPAAS